MLKCLTALAVVALLAAAPAQAEVAYSPTYGQDRCTSDRFAAGELELAVLGESGDVGVPVEVIDREQVARHQVLDLGAVLAVGRAVGHLGPRRHGNEQRHGGRGDPPLPDCARARRLGGMIRCSNA